MVVAVTPKASSRPSPVRKSVRSRGVPGGLSASEALKAAEAAIEPTKPKAPVNKAVPKASVKMTSPVAKAVAPIKTAAEKPAAATQPVAEKRVEPAAKSVVEPIPPVKAPIKAKVEPVKPAVTAAVQPPIKEAAPTAQKVSAEGTKTMNDVIETGKKFAEDAKAKLETAYADLNEKAKAGVEKSTKALEEISDITKGNVEALVESGKIAAKGIETLGQEAVDYSRKNYEKATATIKSFSTIKTPTEFFQLQSQLFASAFDDFSKEAAKGSEAFIKLANEVSQPLTARVTVVTDKIKSLAA
jgi:hypothetical protein